MSSAPVKCQAVSRHSNGQVCVIYVYIYIYRHRDYTDICILSAPWYLWTQGLYRHLHSFRSMVFMDTGIIQTFAFFPLHGIYGHRDYTDICILSAPWYLWTQGLYRHLHSFRSMVFMDTGIIQTSAFFPLHGIYGHRDYTDIYIYIRTSALYICK